MRQQFLAGALSWSIGVGFFVGSCITARAAEPPIDAPSPIAVVEPADDKPVDFEREVLPILRTNCLACHSGAAAESELVLETPQTILKGSAEGPVVVPGDAAKSRLLTLAAHRAEPVMPPQNNKVSASALMPPQLGLIKRWIDQGARGSVSSTALATPKWQPLPSDYQPIHATTMTGDGRLAACSRANRLHVYDLVSGTLAATLVDPALKANGLPAAADVDSIRSLAFNHRGDMLASGGFRTVRLWRRSPPHIESNLAIADISAVAVSSDNQYAGCGSSSGEIRWCKLDGSEPCRVLGKHDARVLGVALSTNGEQLVSVSANKTIRWWNVRTGQAIATWAASSPARAVAWLADGSKLITGHEDGRLRIWPLSPLPVAADTKPLAEWNAHKDMSVTALANLPGQPNQFVSGGEDGWLRLWNAESGKQRGEFEHGAPITSVTTNRDGSRFVSAGSDGRAKLWNVNLKRLVAEFNGDNRLASEATSAATAVESARQSIEYRQEELKLATTGKDAKDQSVALLTQSLEEARKAIPTAKKTLAEKAAALVEPAKERDEAKAKLDEAESALSAATKSRAEAVVRRKLEDQVATARRLAREARERAASPVARELAAQNGLIAAKTALANAESSLERSQQRAKAAEQAVADAESTIKRLEQLRDAIDARTRKQPPLRAAVFSADGKQLILAGDAPWIQWIDVESATLGPGVETSGPCALALAPLDSSRALALGQDGRAAVWNIGGEWRLERTIGRADDPKVLADRILRVAFSPDDRQLATAGGYPGRTGELKLWNVDDGRLLHDFAEVHTDTVFGLAFSPKGDHLASTSADRMVKIFAIPSGELTATLSGHTHYVLTAAWQADGKTLTTAGADCVIKIWDVDNQEVLRTVKGDTYKLGEYRREITGLAFVGPGELFAAASGDGSVRLHRTSSTRDVKVFPGASGFVQAISASRDGRAIAAGGDDGVLRVWSVITPKLVHAFDPPQ